MTEPEMKKFCGFVPAEEVYRFRAAFPQYGATQWFLTTALKRFNDEIAAHPRSVDLIDASIKSMLKHEGPDTATSINSAGSSGANAI